MLVLLSVITQDPEQNQGPCGYLPDSHRSGRSEAKCDQLPGQQLSLQKTFSTAEICGSPPCQVCFKIELKLIQTFLT